MAITTINLNDQLTAFVNKTNEISTNLGDVSTLVNGDSDVVRAINSLSGDKDALDSDLSVVTSRVDSDVALNLARYLNLLSADSDINNSIDSVNTSLVTNTNILQTNIDSVNSYFMTEVTNNDSDILSIQTDVGDITGFTGKPGAQGAGNVSTAVGVLFDLISTLDSNLDSSSGSIVEVARNSLAGVATGTGFGTFSYDSSTGTFTYGKVTAANIRSNFTGGTNTTYNSTQGSFSISDAVIRGKFTAGTNTTYNSTDGSFSISDTVIRSKFTGGSGVDIDASGVITADLGEVTTTTGAVDGNDFVMFVDGDGVTKKQKFNEISLTNFNNDLVTPITATSPLSFANDVVSLNLNSLTNMTAAVDATQDALVLLDNGTQKKKTINTIPLSSFNNDLNILSQITINTGNTSALDGGGTGDTFTLSVERDETTIEINPLNNELRVKNGGITESKLAGGSVSQAKLKSANSLTLYNSAGAAVKTIYGPGA